MFTIVTSSTTINCARQMKISAVHRRGLAFVCALGARLSPSALGGLSLWVVCMTGPFRTTPDRVALRVIQRR